MTSSFFPSIQIINYKNIIMDAKQTTLNNFLQLSSDSEPDEESQYTPSPQKSALKIPDQWTRVRSRESMSHGKISVFDIERDL